MDMRVEPALLLYIVPRPSLFVCLFHFVVLVWFCFCGRIMHRSNYYDGPPGRNLCAVGVGYRSTSWTLPLANNSNVTKDIMDPSGAKPKRTTTRRRKKKKKKKRTVRKETIGYLRCCFHSRLGFQRTETRTQKYPGTVRKGVTIRTINIAIKNK